MIITKTFYVSSPELAHEPEMWYESEENCREANSYSGMKLTRLHVTIMLEPVTMLDHSAMEEMTRAMKWCQANPQGKLDLAQTVKAMRAESGLPTLSSKTCKVVAEMVFTFEEEE